MTFNYIPRMDQNQDVLETAEAQETFQEVLEDLEEFEPAPTPVKVVKQKRRGNPNWGKPETIGPVQYKPTAFEEAVKQLRVQPGHELRSSRLRDWARKNKGTKYIPEDMLKAWGLDQDIVDGI